MIESPVEPPTTYKEQIAILWPSKRGLRMLGYFALMYVLIPFLLGLVFMTIWLPLTLALTQLMFIFTPAYHFVGRMLGVQGLPAHLAKPPIWVAVCSYVWIIFNLAIVAIFIRILFIMGFWQQNLAYVVWQLLVK